jgi:epoxyqueuosine reductase
MEAGLEAALDRRELTRAVKAEALRLGFAKAGVAEAGHADPEGRFRAWLERGYDGGLDYLARNYSERVDPSLLVQNARSVIALSMAYHPGEREEPTEGPRIARYARGADYHRVIRRKVRKLRRFILARAPGHRVHPAVDTSPVLERVWAERAGIAWIGKSAMAIAADLGTYTFLAVLITDLPLEPDPPHPDRCGSCTACLDACPTDAFVAPRVLDARRCITTWNVEHQGEFGPGTPPLSGWLAGCDVCQEVCPWNKFAGPPKDPHFLPRPELAAPDLASFLADGRPDAIRGTALERTGATAMKRNAERLAAEAEKGGR